MIFPLSSMLDPLNIKAQPLPAWPHSRIGPRSTAEGQDGRNQELEPWTFIQRKGWGVSPVWKVNQSIQKAQWLREVDRSIRGPASRWQGAHRRTHPHPRGPGLIRGPSGFLSFYPKPKSSIHRVPSGRFFSISSTPPGCRVFVRTPMKCSGPRCCRLLAHGW